VNAFSRPASRRLRWPTLVRHVVVTCFVLSILLPLAWVLLLSVKSLPDSNSNKIWPDHFDFSHYGYAWQRIEVLPRVFLNSAVVTTGSVIVTTVCAVLAGYALVHLHTPGRRLVFGLLVASMFFPTRVTAIIAIWQIQKRLGLLNVTWGLILPYVTLTLALCVFVMRGIFEGVPKELADAARIDGAGPVRVLLGVMLPLVRNGVIVVVVISFVAAWGDFLLAATLIYDESARTLPVVLASVAGGWGAWAWPRIAAAYVIAITPALVTFGIAQRWYLKGLQEGALKV
jgi:ABC-type glycerol-3-phosphate transport system permease component